MLTMNVSLVALSDFAKEVVSQLPKTAGPTACVIGLSGELGAGKTAFAQEVAKALGVAVPVTSPTFILVRPYPIAHPPFSRLIHIDAYRLSPGEKDTFGWRDYAADPHNLILAEWPERLPGGMPAGARAFRFTVVDNQTRDITETYAG